MYVLYKYIQPGTQKVSYLAPSVASFFCSLSSQLIRSFHYGYTEILFVITAVIIVNTAQGAQKLAARGIKAFKMVTR